MLDREFMLLVTSFRRLLRRNATKAVKKMIRKTHAADLALVFRSFTDRERRTIFELIEDENYKAELIAELDEDIFNQIISDYEAEEIKKMILELPEDDEADILEKLPDQIEDEILDSMGSERSEEIGELLKYSSDTAGGLMRTLPFKMNQNSTVSEAIKTVQHQEDMELVFYVYVVDDEGRLTGVLSLRELLSVSPGSLLKEVMRKDLISVKPSTDQEKVARIISRYDFMALPVVDNNNKLLGIVTIDDIIDVMRDEATEDFLQMAGVGKSHDVLSLPTSKSIAKRFPWLFATFLGGVIASLIVMQFENLVTQFALISSFIPIIAGMGGNVGIQSSIIIVRGISTDMINYKRLGKVVLRQISIGTALGLGYGLFLSLFSILFYQGHHMIGQLALATGVALLFTIIIASTVGSIIPLVFDRINIDPAIATGPIVTTCVDVISVTAYLSFAYYLLIYLY